MACDGAGGGLIVCGGGLDWALLAGNGTGAEERTGRYESVGCA